MTSNVAILDPRHPGFDAVNQRIDAAFHENGKGLAHGDLNGDGYVDLVGTNSSGPIWRLSRALGPRTGRQDWSVPSWIRTECRV